MSFFDRFKRKPIAEQPTLTPGVGEKMVRFADLGMH